MQVNLPQALQAKIFAQMEAGYPNEAGGFLLGTPGADHVTIVDITEIENTFEAEEQFHRYAMTPQDWMRLEDEADAKGLTLVGYYHSHPNSPAIPSEYDRVHALPNFVYIITQVNEGPHAVDQRVWRLTDSREKFDALELVITR